MLKKPTKVLEILGGIFLICICITCILVFWEFLAWYNLGNRLGISPTMASLDQYVRNTISVGMSYTEVHETFDSIGRNTCYTYSSEREQCETVYLLIGPLPLLEPGYDICYNDDKLESLSTVY